MQIEIARYDKHLYNRLSYGGTHRKLHKTIMFLYIFIDHKTLNVLHLIQYYFTYFYMPVLRLTFVILSA